MDYLAAQATLGKRDSRKLENNTYLVKLNDADIAIRLHATYVVTFDRDGSVTFKTGGWSTVTTKDRINAYAPDGMSVYSKRGIWILSVDRKKYGFGDGMTVLPDRSVIGDRDLTSQREELREGDREHSRLRYWVRKARTPPEHSRLKLEDVLAEPNASIRVAKIHVYGLDRFMVDAKALTISEEAGYELLDLALPFGSIRALKMRCSTTKTVYINTVPPYIRTVREAADWMYDTENYLDKITQQS